MQLRYFIYAVLFLVLSFVFNIFFYFISSDYRNFLRSIKEDKIENNYQLKEETDLNLENNYNEFTNDKKDISNINDDEHIENINNTEKNNKKENNKNLDLSEIKVEYKSSIDKVKETNIEKEFLNKFKEYKLKKLELHPRLFDLTTEYPDDYIEYYSEYLTLYFFGEKPYDDIKDIFQVLTYELPFSINEVNNFWDKSFYINLDPEFQDWQVRIVLSYKNRTFWLKMTKEVYPLIKEKLNRLK